MIGKGGAVLKEVGIAVREQLPEGAYLELFVKVDKDWQRRATAERLGSNAFYCTQANAVTPSSMWTGSSSGRSARRATARPPRPCRRWRSSPTTAGSAGKIARLVTGVAGSGSPMHKPVQQ